MAQTLTKNGIDVLIPEDDFLASMALALANRIILSTSTVHPVFINAQP